MREDTRRTTVYFAGSILLSVGCSDIQPLIDNTGLGAREVGAGSNPGDRVSLMGTSVSCADIAALEAEGANVISDCP